MAGWLAEAPRLANSSFHVLGRVKIRIFGYNCGRDAQVIFPVGVLGQIVKLDG
jgi:hypothetical protein